MRVRQILCLALGLVGLIMPAQDAQAEAPRWYQIEVLVYIDEANPGNELWPEVAPFREERSSIRLNSGAGTAYQTLSSKPAFGRYLKALAGDSKQVVFHQSWKQPVAERQQAPFIRVQGGNRYGDRNELEGYIKISAKRYLHIDADLWWNRFEPGGQEIDLSLIDPGLPRYGVGQNFHFEQSRRMRSNETHYLDSPVMGILVRATPLDN